VKKRIRLKKDDNRAAIGYVGGDGVEIIVAKRMPSYKYIVPEQNVVKSKDMS
jgi:hypothetical protein